MDSVLKIWLIAFVFILQTKASYQDCGERFVDKEGVSRSRRIIGGHEAAVNSWPWLVNFVSSTNKSFQVCSGSLIDPSWILTTAHCFVLSDCQYAVDEWTYIAGDHYLHKTDPHEQVLYPEELYIHPKFVLSSDYAPGDYDIALIRLKKPAKITPQVRTVCLPNDTQENIENKTHFVVGWGNTEDIRVYKRSDFLKELRLNIIPKETCNTSYGGNITQRQLCAAHPGGEQDACFGDSGGPLQYMNKDGKWVLSGTVSWGRGCARKNFYGVYTNVKVLLPYINKIIKGGTSCGVRNKSTLRPKRIVGGTEASMNAWPWAVNMINKNTQKQVCGGSIIASNWILTAAHCFLTEGRETNVEQYEYLVGDHVLEETDKGQQQLVPEFAYIHPDYNPPTMTHPGNFDVCLIKLKYSMEWSDIVKPICLPDESNLPPTDNLRCYAIGWGNTQDKREYTRPRALKQLRVNVIPQDKCNSNASYNGSVPDTFFCAGYPEGLNDTCQGDSGGPLQCDYGDDTWSLRGLVSWGIGCAKPNKFGVYSNVSKLMSFLNKIMSGHDLFLRRIEKMTVLDIQKQNPSTKDILELCSWTFFSLIHFAHPNVTKFDIVRSWALMPSKIVALKVVSPKDVAVALDWEVQNTCKSKTFEQMLAIVTGVNVSINNNTLTEFGERLNMTIHEMAFFLRKTVGSLLLMHSLKFDKLRKKVDEGKVVEAKVSRMMQLVAFLKKLQPSARFDEEKLNKTIRSYSYDIVKNLTDDSLRQILSKSHIDVFTKYVQLKNLGIFFGNLTLKYLKGLRLSDIVVDLLGIDQDGFARRYSGFDVADCVNSTVLEVENYWKICNETFTLEKLLIASWLMKEKYNCNNCNVHSELYVPDCNLVCVPCSSKECSPVSTIEGRAPKSSTITPQTVQLFSTRPVVRKSVRQVSNIKLALIFGVFSGCLVAFIIILLICFISKQHRSRNASASEKVMTDEELAKSNESLAYKTASNNNIVFLPQDKTMNGKGGSYVALECCDMEKNRCNGNLESIL